MKNYPAPFLLLFSSCIFGGLALQNVFAYSMLVGVSLGMICLVLAMLSLGKRNA